MTHDDDYDPYWSVEDEAAPAEEQLDEQLNFEEDSEPSIDYEW